MKEFWKNTDAEFLGIEPILAKTLLKFYNSKNFNKQEFPEIKINNVLYVFKLNSISKGRSLYFSTEKGIIRISDHWSKSDYKNKKFNIGFISTCFWSIKDCNILSYYNTKYLAGFCHFSKFVKIGI